MGRNKIKFEKISNETTRQITYYKRKRGLLKKAMELSVLCGVKVLLCIVDKRNKVNLFSSEKPEKFFSEYLQEKIKSKNNLGVEDYSRLFKKQKAKLNEIKIKKKPNPSSEEVYKKSAENFECTDSLENSIDSISLAPSIKMQNMNDKLIHLGNTNNVNFTLEKSDLNEENFSNFSKKRKSSLKNSPNVNRIGLVKESFQLDSKINLSTKRNFRNSSNFSNSKLSSLGDKNKKIKFINYKDVNITDDIENIPRVSIFNENAENSVKCLPIQANSNSNINGEIFPINDSANSSDKTRKKLNYDISKEIQKEKNHNFLNTSNYERIQSSDLKTIHQPLLHNKHSRTNEFMAYDEFINNIKSVNNINIFNQINNQSNDIASHLSNLFSNTNLQNANIYSDVNPNCILNINQLFSNNHPYQKFNNSSSFVNEYFDENDFKNLKELEKLIKLQK